MDQRVPSFAPASAAVSAEASVNAKESPDVVAATVSRFAPARASFADHAALAGESRDARVLHGRAGAKALGITVSAPTPPGICHRQGGKPFQYYWYGFRWAHM